MTTYRAYIITRGGNKQMVIVNASRTLAYPFGVEGPSKDEWSSYVKDNTVSLFLPYCHADGDLTPVLEAVDTDGKLVWELEM